MRICAEGLIAMIPEGENGKRISSHSNLDEPVLA
jgi:hypothetical protein